MVNVNVGFMPELLFVVQQEGNRDYKTWVASLYMVTQETLSSYILMQFKS